jgi:RNA polymerase sigma-70 factor, ECF subfamily
MNLSHPQPTDQELMQRIVLQDQQAFHAIYQLYGKAIYSLAYRIMQDTTLAEEVTQDTLLKVWQQKAQWNPAKGALKSWLLAITHYTAIDRIRQERRQPTLHPSAIEDVENEISSVRADAGWQDEITLRMLIAQIPTEQAFLIELAFFRGMTHSEIAAETNLPLGTVKTRLRSGLHHLRVLWLESVKNTVQPQTDMSSFVE